MTYTIPFTQLNKSNIPTAGGKGANLGEMTTAGFPVPSGFVLTTAAYDVFVEANGLQQQIVDLAHTVAANDPQSSEAASAKIKQLFLGAEMPAAIVDAVMTANDALGETAVAVRSSATAEDLPDASFAGQQETFLNVQGKDTLLDAVKRCWASLWTARAITYRIKQEIAPAEVSLAVVVQKQIASDVSGVAFSLNPNNNDYDEAVIRGIANVLESPYEKPLNKGEILVTRATDPGWTPLFINASGVVLEVGGALQQGAVIAREYGLPCVSGVERAINNIPDGAMIEVAGRQFGRMMCQ